MAVISAAGEVEGVGGSKRDTVDRAAFAFILDNAVSPKVYVVRIVVSVVVVVVV